MVRRLSIHEDIRVVHDTPTIIKSVLYNYSL
nr:MAG TPA: hypothetical protein [Bacteriophage sp.]DAZ72245.1 MAG TPA: hypothetical protein [Caudoviricetes sp.]